MSIEARFAQKLRLVSSWWASADRDARMKMALAPFQHVVEDEEDERVNARMRLEVDHEAYKADGNPLHAFSAVLEAWNAKVPLPGWAHGYLARAAYGLFDLRREFFKHFKSPGRGK